MFNELKLKFSETLILISHFILQIYLLILSGLCLLIIDYMMTAVRNYRNSKTFVISIICMATLACIHLLHRSFCSARIVVRLNYFIFCVILTYICFSFRHRRMLTSLWSFWLLQQNQQILLLRGWLRNEGDYLYRYVLINNVF